MILLKPLVQKRNHSTSNGTLDITSDMAWAVETEREEAQKRMEEESAVAAEARAARAEIATDVDALMDLGI
jgi:hypothetical protein